MNHMVDVIEILISEGEQDERWDNQQVLGRLSFNNIKKTILITPVIINMNCYRHSGHLLIDCGEFNQLFQTIGI